MNRGDTPATKIINTAIVDIFEYPLPVNFKFPELSFATSQSKSVLFKDQILFARHSPEACLPEEINEITSENGNLRIYVFGAIRYVDIFGEPHETLFCSSVVADNNLRIVFHGGNVEPPRYSL